MPRAIPPKLTNGRFVTMELRAPLYPQITGRARGTAGPPCAKQLKFTFNHFPKEMLFLFGVAVVAAADPTDPWLRASGLDMPASTPRLPPFQW